MTMNMKRAAIFIFVGAVWAAPLPMAFAQEDGAVQAFGEQIVPLDNAENSGGAEGANGAIPSDGLDISSDTGIESLEFQQVESVDTSDGQDILSGQLEGGLQDSSEAGAQDALQDGDVLDDTELTVEQVEPPVQRPAVRIEDFIPITEISTSIERAMLDRIEYLNPSVNIATMPSLFFSRWEHDLIIDARKGLNTRPADAIDDGVPSPSSMPTVPGAVSGPRDISLNGIIYRSKDDWVIWLNNMRISPGRLPNQIMDLKVFKDYVEVEWFDPTTNQIFPVRLRTHQRFNIDARIFLPGGP